MPEDYFGEHVAARYDENEAGMFDPAVVEPVVDFLAELAGDAASPCTGSTCRRRWWRGCARSRAPSGSA
jgi:hypothetical protein